MIRGRNFYVIYSCTHFYFTPDAHQTHLLFDANKQPIFQAPSFLQNSSAAWKTKRHEGGTNLKLVASITSPFPYNLKHIIRGYSLYHSQKEFRSPAVSYPGIHLMLTKACNCNGVVFSATLKFDCCCCCVCNLLICCWHCSHC